MTPPLLLPPHEKNLLLCIPLHHPLACMLQTMPACGRRYAEALPLLSWVVLSGYTTLAATIRLDLMADTVHNRIKKQCVVSLLYITFSPLPSPPAREHDDICSSPVGLCMCMHVLVYEHACIL